MKLQFITDLANYTAQSITKNADNWSSFLRTAAWNYKYPFAEQVLIYAQRPEATACASIQMWNEKMHRWVKKGSRGIALIDDRTDQHRLRYVFDVSDTEDRHGTYVYIWSMEHQHKNAVIETLEGAFGVLSNKENSVDAIISAVNNSVEDNITDYFTELVTIRENSYLEDLDDFNVMEELKQTLCTSVGYMLLERCGFGGEEYYEPGDFIYITDFNTLPTISLLGNATSDISEIMLREIEGYVKSQHVEERNTQKFAHSEKIMQNRGKAENIDGSENYEIDLHNAGGLSSTRSDDRSGTGEYREIWDASQIISAGEPESTIHQPSHVRQADGASVRNRSNSEGADRARDVAGSEKSGSDRGTEGNRSNEVDRNDEQYQAGSGGNNSGGAHLQLNILNESEGETLSDLLYERKEDQHEYSNDIQQRDLLTSVKDQIELIEEAEAIVGTAQISSAFLTFGGILSRISQEDIDAVLTSGSGIEGGKYRIYLQYQKNMSNSENALFLKDEYGWGGRYPALHDRDIDEMHDGKGIKLSVGSILNPAASIVLPWSKVARHIGELITLDRYLSEKEKSYLPTYQQMNAGKQLPGAEQKATSDVSNDRNSDPIHNLATRLNDFMFDYDTYGYNDALEVGMTQEDMASRIEEDLSNPEQVKAYIKELGSIQDVLVEDSPYQKQVATLIFDLQAIIDVPVYEFHLGDTVYLGASEYEVDSFDHDHVVLRDAQFPLFTEVVAREDFDRKLRENPLNSHLIITDRSDTKAIHAITQDIKTTFEQSQEEIAAELVGKVITIDNRKFCVDSVNIEPGTVSLKDITFAENTGFPIFRRESIGFALEHLSENEHETGGLKPSWEKRGLKTDIVEAERTPEIKQTDRINFQITNNELGYGGPKEKYSFNAAAIRLLKSLENENRLANAEEQEILSRYVGWGGIPQAFDKSNASWAKEYAELHTLLDDEEYTSARESTLNAHYTSPIVIKAMYQAIENMGFRKGNILEPACGIGNFFGLVPECMGESKLYGVELDSITGRIAKQLYQINTITIQGYESTALPDSFFDVAIGNVPFGQYKVADKKYDKLNFLIHDYFFAKTLDKVRPGGVIAFVTSSGTMDKQNCEVRKYIAQRAELLGAIRMPNDAFLKNAGTGVVADILFLQKRDRVIDIDPSWIHLGKTPEGYTINSYFVEHPEMVLGNLTEERTQYGKQECTCTPIEGDDLADQLAIAVSKINAVIDEHDVDDITESEDNSIPADPSVRNFSFATVDGKLYYRENSRMNPVETSTTAESRIKGMIEIRDFVRTLIEYQTEDYGDEDIGREQLRLNQLYDRFTSKYGLLNSRANNTAFSDDSSYCLLCSLEILNENGELERKADMFTKRTIRHRSSITRVDTPSEALALSIAEKARVDMAYMSDLTELDSDQLEEKLSGVIFRLPASKDEMHNPYFVTADEYLSGNVREKLRTARMAAEISDVFLPNVKALEAVQPQDLTASEISVRLGATWVPTEIVREFIFELLGTPRYLQWDLKVHYSTYTSEWNIEGKSRDRSSIKAFTTYGTNRINAYKIIEETLNLRDVRIFDAVYDADGTKRYVLNKKETTIAQQKQELIKAEFAEWVWRDPERREVLTRLYNDKFNSIRPREYDGRHIKFVGMNPEITLRPHQINAIAHILYGGNTLLAHVVGAGKTYEMVAAAMESKRLGLCQKSLFVVPNHLTEQWAAEFLQLYPSANILVATRKDFETKNRKKFCGRIATGEYDAIIIGHSQFEKIPVSIERQRRVLQEQLDEITEGIADLRASRGENITIKQLEKTKKTIKLKLAKLNDQSRKDDVVTFEELGVDRLFVDEAHGFKNLFLYTKMRNVGGIAQTEAQKSSDLFMKCRYMDELTGGRGTVFATGTPVSNSMVELYTIQRYLQFDTLRKNGLQHFDAWASTFGETVTAIELSPEGTGYRAKTRFAKFYNLPELMSMFKEVADIQTADMLDLPVPKANYSNIALKPSELQKNMVTELSERADRVRNRMVDASVDNMLLITNDGRKLALDQRLMNPLLPDDEKSKASVCADNIFELWVRHCDKRLTQLVFCDLSTPHYNGSFNVYDDIKQKLIGMGVPAEEVAFIHDANTEAKKAEMFAKVRSGQIRVLFGSTFKMGAGTNVQDRLIALHDLDCPWRPSDLEQRSGRIIRQGNKNPEVEIYRYVTENTFDAYLYQLVENKQRFIGQIMTSKSPVRSAEDIDETALSYAEIKALATGNPYIKEKMDLDIQVAKLKLLKANHLSQRYALEDQILKQFPVQIRQLEERIAGYKADMEVFAEHSPSDDTKPFMPMTLDGITYSDKAGAGTAILESCKKMTSPDPVIVGNYRGFALELSFDSFSKEYRLTLIGVLSHTVSLGVDIYGNIMRIDNALEGLKSKLTGCGQQLENTLQQMETAKTEALRPFAQEDELKSKTTRLAELDALLNLEQKGSEIVDEEPDEEVAASGTRQYTR